MPKPRETEIAWCDSTWNPWSGCVRVSEGCDNCYAETLAERRAGTPAFPNGFGLTLRPHRYEEPLHWHDRRFIFVNSMSDFGLGTVPAEVVRKVWETMLKADWHVYMILTKRPVALKRILADLGDIPDHVWIGVSVENQRWADGRIPQLLDIPARTRFLSCEPLLGCVDLTPWASGLSWVIDGGESGQGRRPADPGWFRDIRDACIAAGVPYFHKQGNAFRAGQDRELDGQTWNQRPEMLPDPRRPSMFFDGKVGQLLERSLTPGVQTTDAEGPCHYSWSV